MKAGSIIVCVSLVLMNFQFPIDPFSNTDGPTFPLEVSTDKYYYTQGEEVVVTLTNVGDKTIDFLNPPGVQVTNSTGHIIVNQCPSVAQVVIPLPAGESLTRRWDQEHFLCSHPGDPVPPNGEQVAPGRYKLIAGSGNARYAGEKRPVADSVWIEIGPVGGAPVADAGPDQSVYVGDTVHFNGSGSHSTIGEAIPIGANMMINDVKVLEGVGGIPRVALDSDGGSYVTWTDTRKEGGVFFDYASNLGTFGPDKKVGEYFSGWSDISLSTNDDIHIAWVQTDILYSVSTDGGLTFSTPVVISEEDTPPGYPVRIDAGTDGSVHVVWGNSKGKVCYRSSSDGGGNWNQSLAIADGGFPDVAISENGSVYVTWQGLAEGSENASILFSRKIPNGSFEPVVTPHPIESFYHINPSIAVGPNDEIYIAWVEFGNGEYRIAATRSLNGGLSFETPNIVRLVKPAEYPGIMRLFDVAVATFSSAGVAIAWDEYMQPFDPGAEIRVSISLDRGESFGAYRQVDDLRQSGKRMVAIDGNSKGDIYVAWHDGRDCRNLGLCGSNIYGTWVKVSSAPLRFDWDFGDGSNHSVEMNPTHIYSNPGDYNVALTVTDDRGVTDSDYCIITVLSGDLAPIADAGPDQTVYEGDAVQFDGTGSFDPDAGWATTTVDTLIFQNAFASMALDSRDFPGIGYTNVTDRELRYAKWNGTEWEYATVDSLGGGSPSLDFNGSDYPSMSYWDGDNRDLKYAWWNGTGWNNRTVDSLGMVGAWSSLAIGDDDHPRISYYDYTNQDLKYAWWNGTDWLNETVDWLGVHNTGSSLAFDRHGNPHISYSGELKIGNQVYHPLKYAWKNGSMWDIQFVSVDPSIAYSPSLALDRNDFAHISHYEGVGGSLVYTHWNGTAWNMETVDHNTGPLAVGGYPSLALDSRDYPHISYLDAKNGTVKHTFWNGTAWIIETVDNANFGTTSLAIDENDSPRMVYFSGADFDLKYAKKGGGIASYDWDFGDGSPHETGARPTHVYADNGNYTVTLKVTDNAGLSDTDTCIITVLNVAPTADANGLYQGFEGTPVHFEGNHTDPGANDTHTYEWDFNYDGTIFTPDVTGNPSQKTWYDDYSGNIALRITDDDGGWDLDVTAVTVLNVPPRAEAGEDKEGHEVSTFTFNGSFYDPGANDTHEYAWDFDYDGISFDVEATGQSVTHTFVDDFDGDIALRVTDDDGGVGIDAAHVLVKNVPPTITLEVLPIEVDAFLRIAGEKWHDVSIDLFKDGTLIANGAIVRYPGSPNDQMLDLSSLQFDHSKKYTATVTYTPDDDPINGQPNGANPCWIILRFSDGQELWMHHTFNVNHPDTYVWEVDLTAAILSHGMTFEAIAFDPGADELTFHWDFGDGTNATSFYPNGNGTYPVAIMEIIIHVFPGSGTYTVTVTVEDDDGGVGVAMITITIP